jgi:fibronectin-binding autotransporter adhesin
VADSTVHNLTDGVTVADNDEFYATRSPYAAGNDVKLTGAEIAAKAPVQSVFGRTGAVAAASNDYSFAQLSGVASNAQGGIGKVTLTQPATGSTLTIADGKTLTASNTVTLTATDGSSLAIGTGGTLGTAAFVNTGTSGATVPLLGGANTFSANTTFSGTNNTFSGAAVTAIQVTSNSGGIRFRNDTNTVFRAAAAATYAFGAVDAAAPTAQSLQVQNVVAGNTNTAGATFTIQGSLSNGSGGGDVVVNTTLSSAASGTQNTAATAMTFKGGTQDCIAGGFLGSSGFVRVSTQFDKTADTALANITGLSVSVAAGNTYQFRAVLFVTGDAVGGQKYAIAGTATATAIVYEVMTVSNSANAIVISSKQTVLGGSVGQAGSTDDFTTIEGLITVNAAGTLTVQFAQNAANGTSSVLVGSHMLVHKVA